MLRQDKTIGFIGLGNMGGPMALNLLKAGFTVIGYDLQTSLCEQAAATGVSIKSGLVDVAANADIVITMLPAGAHVVAVWNDAVKAARPGVLFIDCSTISVEAARAAHKLAAEAGLESLDAPVSGGVEGAVAGTLTFMVGGDQAARERAQAVLSAMGRRVVACGEDGAGQAAKICNNMLLGISMVGTSEAFALGKKLGLTYQALFDVLSTSSGQCFALTTHCPVPGPVPNSAANRAYKAGFASRLMLKDLELSQVAANSTQIVTPLGKAARDLFLKMEARGDGEKDYSAIIQLIEMQ
jgi:3-hydroxyisobutyrate dehydrogenase